MRTTLLLVLLLATTTLGRQHQRSLATEYFVPLSCNANPSPCQPWSTVFGISAMHLERLIVPCGTCVRMDMSGTLVLRGGLDIQGTLEFPDTNGQLVIETTMIVVQGVLQMRARKPIDGRYTYKFILTDEVDQYFTPIEENALSCGGNDCLAGMKSITVAGGRVDIVGVPQTTKTWTKLSATTNHTIDVLVDGFSWRPGAEILITSATRNPDNVYERTIVGTQWLGAVHGFPGTVWFGPISGYRLTLNEPIGPTTTLKDHSVMAVEVALLSRNIVWEGGEGSDDLMGGHFWILRTPGVPQHLEGVDIQNFGQQGVLARYPIHVHFGYESNSVEILRNTIRDSNQRCLSIHGTNSTLVQDNVAYNIKGHCFLTSEDGIETKNRYIRNLGAVIEKPSRLVPNEGTNGKESDKFAPSVFWITNPQNTFIGNVAAGGVDGGFWVEALERGIRKDLVQGHNINQPFDVFRDNVAHSHKLYPKGYRPSTRSVIEGFKSYRNSATGSMILRSSNLDFKNCFFADNDGASIATKGPGGYTVTDTEFVALSDDWRRLLDGHGGCRRPHVAISQVTDAATQGPDPIVTMSNIVFDGYNNATCSGTAFSTAHAIDHPDHESFSTSIKTSNTQWDTGNFPIDFCEMKDMDLDWWISDADGSMRPPSLSGLPSGPGSLLTTLDRLTHFVDLNQCVEIPEHCLTYCPVCFQSIYLDFRKDVTKTRYQLKVCRASDSNDCTFFNSHDTGLYQHVGHTQLWAHLPPGSYVAQAVYKDTGEFIDLSVKRRYAVKMGGVVCSGGFAQTDFVMSDGEQPTQSSATFDSTESYSQKHEKELYELAYTSETADLRLHSSLLTAVMLVSFS